MAGGAAAEEGGRLEFLDALRGVAAFAVMIQHTLELRILGYLPWSLRHFDLGTFGVVIFFVVSGFIIPASMERGGSLRGFWGGRFFRLFPAYWLSLVVVLLLGYAGLRRLPASFYVHPVVDALANATMLQVYLGAPEALGVYWTLALELAFYVLCSLLFLGGWLRRSLLWAWVAVGAMALMVFGVGMGMHRSIPAGRVGLLVTAFVGTAIFRASSKENGSSAVFGLIGAGLITLLAGFWYRFVVYPTTEKGNGFSFACVTISWAAAFLFFALFYALRSRRFRGWMLWLGRISYSLYLVHDIVVEVLPVRLPVGWFFGLEIVASLGISSITYKYVERPAILFHRRWVRARSGEGEREVAAG